MMRSAATATLLLVGVAACTTGEATRVDAGTTHAMDPSTAVPTQSQSSPPGQPSSVPELSRVPLVIATNITRPALRLTAARARRIVAGGVVGRRVVAAPGLDTGVRSARSARAALRVVERDPDAVAVVPASAMRPTVRAALVDGVDPIRRPARYPLSVPGEAAPDRPVTLTVVGDIMLGRGVPDPAAALRPMARRLRAADVTVGNLESTLSTAGAPQQGGDSFAAAPSVVPLLHRAGFDALSLANNHTGDYQTSALVETVRALRDSPVEPFGAGRDLADASSAAVVRRHGLSFGFLGFNAIGETPRATPRRPGALAVRMPPRTGPLHDGDLRHVTRLVRHLDRRVDVVVVLPHWGTQYTHRPEPVQRLVSRALVDAGADLVVGGHPHWVQGVDVVDGVVVAHSLGNFVFDMDFMTETQRGVVLEATFWGDRLMAVELVPYRMDARFTPRPAAPSEAAQILDDVWSNSTGPFRVR